MTPDGKYILAPAVWNNQVLIIDAKTGTVVKTIITGLDPVNIRISPDSKTAYISNGRSYHVSKMDLRNLTLSEINTAPGSNGIALFSKQLNRNINQPESLPIISMGTLLPLSGEKMMEGREMIQGYEFLRDDINQHGGLKIGDKSYQLVIHYLDTRSDEKHLTSLADLRYAYQLIVGVGGADASRVGLAGYSLGGYSVLRAMQLNHQGKKDLDIPFKLAASFYGHAHRFASVNFAGNIGLFWGDDDYRAPLTGAVNLIKNASLSDIKLYHYPDAKHGFDNAYFPASVELTDEEGQIYHLGYNKEAHSQSINDLLSFLTQL